MPSRSPMPPVHPFVGERRNYNFQDHDNYEVWPFSTIEALAESEQSGCKCDRARVIVVGGKLDKGINIAFNSYHQDFSDAQHAIDFAKEKIPTGELYNVFGETIDVHTSDHGGGHLVTVVEVKALIWSMQQLP
jgi:hypothetical protein